MHRDTQREGAGGLPELLAPAGGPEAALAAFQYGADAVYAGMPRFSARAEAENFTVDSLGEIAAYAHQLNPRRKVYAALNTLILSREMPEAARLLLDAAEMGLDGLIVQDVGLARLARQVVPMLPLHASTQLAIHSAEGVRALAGLGFTRVVLARELTIAEGEAAVPAGGLEVETFIHGTLCYAYSGLCLFSSHATGRSGNRGRCVYGCRGRFAHGGAESMPFSMRDLALPDRLGALRRAGVVSLKIEGRMKSPLYVAAVTDYYRRLLDGRLPECDRRGAEEDLQTIFSRPWTRLHADRPAAADAIIDGDTTGHRGARIGEAEAVRVRPDGDWLVFTSCRALELHDGLQVDLDGWPRPYGFAVDRVRAAADRSPPVIRQPPGPLAVLLPRDHPPIPAGAAVYCASSQEVKRRYPFGTPRPGVHRCRHPVRVRAVLGEEALQLDAVADVPALGAVCAGVSVSGPFDAARQAGGTQGAAEKAMERLGDTCWRAVEVAVEDPASRFVPASAWNDARRQLAAALDAARAEAESQWLARLPGPAVLEGAAGERWSLRLDAWPQGAGVGAFEGADEVVLPLAQWGGDVPLPVRWSLPLILRGDVETVRGRVVGALGAGARCWEVSGWAGWQVLREAAKLAGVPWGELDISSDWPMPVLNPWAAEAGAACGLRWFVTSPEDEAANLREMLATVGPRAWVMLIQFTPLFLAATGPAGVEDEREVLLQGRKHEDYVMFEEEGVHRMVSRVPYSLAHHLTDLRAMGPAGFRVDLSHASRAGTDPAVLWNAARQGARIDPSHEANYVRGLQ